MAGARLSRRKIADYVARELTLGDAKTVMKELAAYLVDTKRVREAELIVRDIEFALYTHGETIIDTTSAQSLSATVKAEIAKLATERHGATTVHLREHVDPAVLGGVRLEYGGQRLDTTLRHKLNQLRTKQM